MTERRNKSDRRMTDQHPLSDALAAAIERHEVEIVFQPQYACADGSLVGAEALVRWTSPEHVVVSGDLVFAIADVAGLTSDLVRHVRETAMQAAKAWPDHLRLSINVTAADLGEADFVRSITDAMVKTGISAKRLTLEITEQALVRDLERSAQRLRELVDLGMRIALDDFGAGFCNFNYLKVLPLHYLKLDRAMVDGIAQDPRDLAVLRGIIAMAHALELSVIAEGIETADQRAAITSEGCDTWQGFLGAKAMGAGEFAKLARG
ncbi:EAL domain-containing protein [Alteraurantiacibacter aestuarii]|uniref:EAL domain-containing protein n=1 Tax=Alteraurantiacibacter aestuarii TaxID=650004 RepID=UPI0031D50149